MCPVLMVDYQRVDACSLKHLEVLTSVKAKYNLHIAMYIIHRSVPGTLIPTGSSKCMATIVDLTTLPPISPISIINETTQLATSLSILPSTLFESNDSNILFFTTLVRGGTFLGVSITVSSRKRAHYGISPPPPPTSC